MKNVATRIDPPSEPKKTNKIDKLGWTSRWSISRPKKNSSGWKLSRIKASGNGKNKIRIPREREMRPVFLHTSPCPFKFYNNRNVGGFV